MGLLLIWAGGALGTLIPGEPLVTRALGAGVGFILAVLLPAFLFGLPRFQLQWTVDERGVTDQTVIDLRGTNPPAFPFTVEMSAGFQSLLGQLLLRHAKARRMRVWIQFRPLGAVRVRRQQYSVGSALREEDTAPEVLLDVIDDGHDVAQTMFVGSMLPGTISGAGDNVTVVAELRMADGVSRLWWAPVTIGLKRITVRK
ncbi:hypothetical protein N8D77_13520 [Curtobacterium flaccumfaciens]|uniref:hypothetical protein n=1 Tax=Curtobacterium flaccumfaciens TaxID=2035 RepID=UPI0021C5A6F3|nr:hypothetical protein [Curtobacterium flaccumfaciens]UXN21162.1 hypothetical protein N8D77_13520 [Curtobacterium flaccumfaciens pv. flaccumfaciens]